jgi:hypothetical protein
MSRFPEAYEPEPTRGIQEPTALSSTDMAYLLSRSFAAFSLIADLSI